MQPATARITALVLTVAAAPAACDHVEPEVPNAAPSGPAAPRTSARLRGGEAIAGAEHADQSPRATPVFSNLRVLSEHIRRDDLLDRMKSISKSLGVRCNACHRTDLQDFASDEIERKRIARRMMRMVERINAEWFPSSDTPEVTCFTCHQGHPKPPAGP